MTRFSLLLAAALPWLSAQAVAAPAGQQEGTLSFILENDVFYGADRHYTNGMKVVWVPAAREKRPDWVLSLASLVPWFPDNGIIHHGYTFGQSTFGPEDITLTNPPADDRPYAGWLYSSVGLTADSDNTIDQLAFTLGIVGPAALAGRVQKMVHDVVNTDEPQGWDTQLRNEPGLMVSAQRSWRGLMASTLFGHPVDITPHVTAALGNVFTYGGTGLTLRLGNTLPADLGPPRILPGLPGSGNYSPAAGLDWYLFAGVEGRAVARNIFLDGNTFRDSREVDRENLVADVQFGLVFDWRVMRFGYTHVLRTHEFKTQEKSDNFGAFSMSATF